MISNRETISALIEAASVRAVEYRNHFHMYPELSGEERETAAFVADKLRSMGIEVRENIAGYGLIGTIYGKDRTRGVGIRADMDALPVEEHVDSPMRSCRPGVMHACGHDMHTAILLGAADVLNSIKDELPLLIKAKIDNLFKTVDVIGFQYLRLNFVNIFILKT